MCFRYPRPSLLELVTYIYIENQSTDANAKNVLQYDWGHVEENNCDIWDFFQQDKLITQIALDHAAAIQRKNRFYHEGRRISLGSTGGMYTARM